MKHKKIKISISIIIVITLFMFYGIDQYYNNLGNKFYENRTFLPELDNLSFDKQKITKSNYKEFAWTSTHLDYQSPSFGVVLDRIYFINDTLLMRNKYVSSFNKSFALSYFFDNEKYEIMYNTLWKVKEDSIYFIFKKRLGRGYELKFKDGKLFISE